MAEVDLEQLAAAYVHRPLTPAARRRAARAWEACVGIAGWALDVGGGPGDHAAVWIEHGAQALVVDPAPAMAERARRHAGVQVAVGRAEALPLRRGHAALAYYHLSLHHTSWRTALQEAARVLAGGGVLWITSMGPREIEQAFVARWFPGLVEIDQARFPDPDEVAAAVVAAGFTDVHTEVEVESVARTAADWERAARAGFVSSLQLIGPAERDVGIARFRRTYPDPAAVVRYERRFRHLRATRRSLP